MSTRLITLQRATSPDHEELYQVVQLVNCIEPTVGSVLTKRDASELIARYNTKVTIQRAKS